MRRRRRSSHRAAIDTCSARIRSAMCSLNSATVSFSTEDPSAVAGTILTGPPETPKRHLNGGVDHTSRSARIAGYFTRRDAAPRDHSRLENAAYPRSNSHVFLTGLRAFLPV